MPKESAVPLRGRLDLEVQPNPIIAVPVGDNWYELRFDIVMRETGGVDVRIENFTVEALALRGVPVHSQTYPATFITDRSGIDLRHRVGVDNMMWSSDYPHHGNDWPYSRKVIEETMGSIPAGEKAKIIGANATRIWSL